MRLFIFNNLNVRLSLNEISIPLNVFFSLIISIILLRFKRKNTLFIVALIGALFSKFIFGWMRFYEFKKDNSKIDALNIRECELERNYPDYYTYLTKGCHISISDVIYSLLILATSYIIAYILANYIFEKSKRNKNSNQFLLDN